MENSYIRDLDNSEEIVYDADIRYYIERFFSTRFTLYKRICNHKTVKSMELMMGEILNLLDKEYHINNHIKDNEWENFCKFNDNIVYAMDYLNISSKEINTAYKLYNRIKIRNNYKLIDECESYKDTKTFNLTKYIDEKKYIINHSKINYYSHKKPKLINIITGGNIYKNYFNGKDLYLLKIFMK